ncbi:hypothetical protein [Oceanibium sediminis]|uniref:hypothetical protein n=1 Tax=Oceanibium sediminis TaxID=2026339 RepID=UPI000DD30DC7|nr:hypothetical protein [Oceanibium sediminis]
MRLHALCRTIASRLRPAAPGRRIIVHIGPHKTGSTTIQALLRQNRHRLAPLEVICPGDPRLDRIHRIARAAIRPHGAAKHADAYCAAAARLARDCRHLPVVLISNEGLLGPMPTQFGVTGLYLAGGANLASLVSGLARHGAEVEVVFYRREMNAWTRSLIAHLGADGLTPEGFRTAHRIPHHWAGLLRRLRADLGAAAPGARLSVIDFDEDAGPTLGSALLRRAGVTETVLASLAWPAPRRVRSADATDPKDESAPLSDSTTRARKCSAQE